MAKLCNKKILANSLMEWTLASTTTFIDATENTDLIAKADKLGIVLPSPDLAAFETVYCELGKPNLNGVVFSKDVAEKGLKTLVGKQINWNHDGAHQICGYIIDDEIKDNKIYITGILFKSLFTSEFSEVVKLFAEKKLFVSFELWNRNEKGESIIQDTADGNRELTDFIGHGCALLLIDPNTGKPIPPACPKAQVQKLLAAEEVITEAEKIINSAPERDESLVYAELATEEPTCTKCAKCTCQKEGGTDNIMAEENIIEVEELEDDYEGGEIDEAKKLTTEKRNNLPDSDFALIQHKDGKKIRRFPIHDEAHVRNALARLPQAKGLTEEERTKTKNKILRKAKALNMTELLKRHEKALEEALAEEALEMQVGPVNVPLSDKGKKYCKSCQTELTQDEESDNECALCKNKVKADEEKPNPVQKAEEIPAEVKVEEVKPEEIKPEIEAHHEIETVTQKDVVDPKKYCSKCGTVLEDDVEGDLCETCKSQVTPEQVQVAEPAPIEEQLPAEQTQVAEQPVEVEQKKEVVIEIRFSQAEVDAKIVEAQEEILAALPKEVTDCIKEQLKSGKKFGEAAKHCWAEYKKAHEKALADVVGEKDKAIETIKTELDSKNQEIAGLKLEKAQVEEAKNAKPELLVGDVSSKDNDEIHQMAKNVDNIIASKHNQD